MARSWAGFVAVAVASCAGAARMAAQAPGAASISVSVVHVVDGDTIVVAGPTGGRETVRVLGINTPETVDPRRGVQCFGPEASAYTKARLTGRTVQLHTDTETRDRYGRLLARVMLDGESYALELLRLGLARYYVIPPNDGDARSLLRAETEARSARRGVWGAC